MAFADRVLQLKLVADVSDINQGVNKASKKLKGFSRSAVSWTKAFAFGAVIEGFEAVTDVIGDAWDGFREGQKVAAQLGVTWKNLGLDGDELADTIDTISDNSKALGVSDDDAINAFNQLLKTTGDSDKAMRRLKIAQDLVANGSAPNLKSAIKIIDGAIKGSSGVVNKYGLTGKTAGDRVAQLGRRVRGAAKKAADMNPIGTLFNAMNEDLEGIVGSLATGDFSGFTEGLQAVGDDLSGFFDKLGPSVSGVGDQLTGGKFSDWVSSLQSVGADFGPKILGFFEDLGAASGALIAAVGRIVDAIQPLVDILAPAVAGSLGFVLDLIKGVFQTITDLLNGDFDAALADVQATIGTLVSDVQTAIDGVLTALQTILPDLTAAALDIGNAILDGIVGTIGGIADTITGILRDAVNGLIDLLNGFTFTIPEVSIGIPTFRFGEGTIFDTGPQGGGSFKLFDGFTVDPFDIPHLASGGIVTRPTLAVLGEGHHREAVIPLDRGFPGTININVGVGDPIAIGREVDRVLTLYRRGRGAA